MSRDAKSVNEEESLVRIPEEFSNKKDKHKNKESVPSDATKTGCLGMKKKPYKKRIENRSTLQPNKKPPPEQWKYISPMEQNKITPLGVELLYQPETTTIYIYLLTNSTNPVTLEAAAAAIHNVCGGKWNVSSFLFTS